MADDMPLSRPSVRYVAHWQPKQGHAADAYEDAYAVSGTAAFPIRAAVADGATESAFARPWAQTLAEGLAAATPAPDAWGEQVRAWQQAWGTVVAARYGTLPWYAAAKAREGAFAAALGLTLHGDGRWHAAAVGDCCLFHFRGDILQRSWPVEAADAFHSRPALVPSRAAHPLPALERCMGGWQPGDAFALASDAMAAWLLRTDPPAALRFEEAAFRDAVARARAEGTLRNDDVTLLVLHLA